MLASPEGKRISALPGFRDSTSPHVETFHPLIVLTDILADVLRRFAFVVLPARIEIAGFVTFSIAVFVAITFRYCQVIIVCADIYPLS